MRELTDRAHLGGPSGGSTLGTIEGGRIKNPGVFTLYAIASALGVRLEDLMGVQRIEVTTKGRRHERRKVTMLEAELQREREARRVVDEALREALEKLDEFNRQPR
jgi:transcriptional regulator with XRE-family HTH domain